MLKKPIALVALCATIVISCATEDPGLSKDQFPETAAQAACAWIFACCDSVELKSFAGNATDKTSCTLNLRATYAALYQSADVKAWDPKAAQGAVDSVGAAAASCPKAYDPTEILSKGIVVPSAIPGDPCSNTWQCTTRFCKNGVCANPIKAGNTCATGDPCEVGLRCVKETCKPLQPDGSSCVSGTECISGACGGGQCVNSPTYTCDGK